MNRGPAIWATVIAVGLINTGVASLIVVAIGRSVLVPLWLGVAFVVGGVVAAGVAVSLWRDYARSAPS